MEDTISNLSNVKMNVENSLRQKMKSMGYVEVGTFTYKDCILNMELKELLKRKDILIIPDKNSEGSNYKTKLWQYIQRYGSWKYSDDIWYQAHHFKDLRDPEDPISSAELEFI